MLKLRSRSRWGHNGFVLQDLEGCPVWLRVMNLVDVVHTIHSHVRFLGWQRMEEMAIEFGDMLKETLDKMGAQIDLQVA